MKKLLNDVSTVVVDMMSGLTALNPGLRLQHDGRTVIRADARDADVAALVALVSGGGAGHEPAHAGYVGPGMLTAAVAGEVFSSPSTDSVVEAIRAVAGEAGVLLIVKNYTGDRLNFSLAAEIARTEGIDVEMVVVADDVALTADGAHAGRRGLAGTVLVHKVAGAVAAHGRPLSEVAAAARSTAGSLATMGVGLTPCTVPAAGRPGFALGDDEIEWGLGIHGEPGIRRSALEPADRIVAGLLEPIVAELGLTAGSRVALLVNNLGGSAVGEISLVAGVAVRQLQARQVVVERAWAGTFLTALEMAGCSISVLEVDDERLAALDAPTTTTAWPAQLGQLNETVDEPAPRQAPSLSAGPGLSPASGLRVALEAVCAALVEAEPELTELDQAVGDGDLGDSLARGARRVLGKLDSYPGETSPADVLRAVSATVREVVGGTSGPLYAVLLLRGAAELDVAEPTVEDWARAFRAGAAAVQELGGAGPGDRTMVDALSPAASAFGAALERAAELPAALHAGVAAARTGAAETAGLTARLGRSSYLGDRVLGVPDPGAHAVAIWLDALARSLVGDPLHEAGH